MLGATPSLCRPYSSASSLHASTCCLPFTLQTIHQCQLSNLSSSVLEAMEGWVEGTILPARQTNGLLRVSVSVPRGHATASPCQHACDMPHPCTCGLVWSPPGYLIKGSLLLISYLPIFYFREMHLPIKVPSQDILI